MLHVIYVLQQLREALFVAGEIRPSVFRRWPSPASAVGWATLTVPLNTGSQATRPPAPGGPVRGSF